MSRLDRRLIGLLAVLVLALAGCADDGDVAEPADEAVEAADEPASAPGTPGSEPGGPPDETGEPEAEEDARDGPVAPDFTLDLADGGTFTLSAEQRAVYLVFWAEW